MINFEIRVFNSFTISAIDEFTDLIKAFRLFVNIVTPPLFYDLMGCKKNCDPAKLQNIKQLRSFDICKKALFKLLLVG
jgi:hypothetical protein